MSDQDLTERLALLRKPFEPHQISKLPKGGVQLDYVGHAALTDRLLDVDPQWTWEPLALSPDGLPLLDDCGGLWIKLTICGVTRLGYGDAQGKTGANATKERIGDALRNAAMRFGAALDLWHKGELHQDKDEQVDPVKQAAERESAERAEAEAKAAQKSKADAEAKLALADFKVKADEYGFEKTDRQSIAMLAKTLTKKDKPGTADLRLALEMTKQTWNLAIDDTNAVLAKTEVDASNLTPPPADPHAGMSDDERKAFGMKPADPKPAPTEAECAQTVAAIMGGR